MDFFRMLPIVSVFSVEITLKLPTIFCFLVGGSRGFGLIASNGGVIIGLSLVQFKIYFGGGKGLYATKKARIIWNLIPPTIFWYIWKWRNDFLFNGKLIDWDSVGDTVKSKIVIWAKLYPKFENDSFNDLTYNLISVLWGGIHFRSC